ncbi:MAG: creatininase family protein [Crenarchaeota archaeon]|nr:creatininase family protein [Thermoproteota archaeon]
MPRLAERAIGPKAVTVLLPVASLENHGVLPLGADLFIAECVSSRLEARVGGRRGLSIAPVVPYSTAVEHVDAGFTVSVSPPVFIEYLLDVLRSLSRMARSVIVAVFHGGAYSVSFIAARMARQELKRFPIVVYNFWDTVARVLATRYDVKSYPVHADPVEASVLLACGHTLGVEERPTGEVLEEIRARSARLRQKLLPPWIGLDDEGSMYPSEPVPASKELGEVILRESVEDLAALVERLTGPA